MRLSLSRLAKIPQGDKVFIKVLYPSYDDFGFANLSSHVVIPKRLKYIHSSNGYTKKCGLFAYTKGWNLEYFDVKTKKYGAVNIDNITEWRTCSKLGDIDPSFFTLKKD